MAPSVVPWITEEGGWGQGYDPQWNNRGARMEVGGMFHIPQGVIQWRRGARLGVGGT